MFWGFFVMVIIVKEGEWKKKNPPLRSGVQNYVFPSNLSLIEMTKISNTPKPTLLGQNSLVHEVRNKQWALNSLKITTNHSLPSTIFFFLHISVSLQVRDKAVFYITFGARCQNQDYWRGSEASISLSI